MQSPEILPRDKQLDYLIDEDYSDIADMLAGIFEEQGSFVDVDFEEQYPITMNVIQKIAISYMNDDEVSDSVYRCLYQAFFFAYTLARSVARTDTPAVVISNYYSQPTEELFTRMAVDAEEYLAERPAVKGIVHAFIDSIDQSHMHNEAACTVAAVILKQIEDGERNLYIESEVQEFSKQFH